MTSSATASQIDPPRYAQVAVPVHLAKTFTYRLPISMQAVAQVGSRVMVQLGRKPTTGYIVALLPRLRTGTSLVESEIKDVQELLDLNCCAMAGAQVAIRKTKASAAAIRLRSKLDK